LLWLSCKPAWGLTPRYHVHTADSRLAVCRCQARQPLSLTWGQFRNRKQRHRSPLSWARCREERDPVRAVSVLRAQGEPREHVGMAGVPILVRYLGLGSIRGLLTLSRLAIRQPVYTSLPASASCSARFGPRRAGHRCRSDGGQDGGSRNQAQEPLRPRYTFVTLCSRLKRFPGLDLATRVFRAPPGAPLSCFTVFHNVPPANSLPCIAELTTLRGVCYISKL